MLVPLSLVGKLVMRCSHDGHTSMLTLRCVVVNGIGLGGLAGFPCGLLVGTRYEVGSFRMYC